MNSIKNYVKVFNCVKVRIFARTLDIQILTFVTHKAKTKQN